MYALPLRHQGLLQLSPSAAALNLMAAAPNRNRRLLAESACDQFVSRCDVLQKAARSAQGIAERRL